MSGRYKTRRTAVVLCALGVLGMVSILNSTSPSETQETEKAEIEFNEVNLKGALPEASEKKEEYIDARGNISHYKQQCSVLYKTYNPDNYKWMGPASKEQILVMKEQKFYFCQMWKVGTQYWKSLAAFLSPERSHANITFNGDLSRGELEVMESSFRSAMFVRDTWSRLWSAYNDKFSNFHPYFTVKYSKALLEILGIRETFRNAKSENVCLRHVTFSNFIDLILHQVKHKSRFDFHWRPFWTMCHQCGNDYDFIGKLENVKNDVPAMIKKFDLGDPEVIQTEMKQGNYSSLWFPIVKDIYTDRAHRILIAKYKYPEFCQTLRFAFEAKWRSIKNQGYIDRDDPEPTWFSQVPDVPIQEVPVKTRQALIGRCEDEIEAQGAKYSSTQQKAMKVAMFEEALSTLSELQICAIETIYKPDIVLFGYQPRCNKQI